MFDRHHRRAVLLATLIAIALSVPAFSPRQLHLWAQVGTPAASGLSYAALDEDPDVRRKADDAIKDLGLEVREGAIIRGPTREKKLSLVFTGHEFAEGGETILNELEKDKAKASFFLTGDFLANTNFKQIVHRIINQGHYLGPHSDKHLLYCSWENQKKTLVSRAEFVADLVDNRSKLEQLSIAQHELRWFLPPYEHYNQQIAEWSKPLGFSLVNFTPGTRSAADYTGESDTNFVSSKAIFDSIVTREKSDPHGLNGFLLLLHIGSGPGRADKFHARFGELLDFLEQKGYRLVRVDELLTN